MTKPAKDSTRQSDNDQNIELLRQQLEELTAAVQRERADAINLRRRHEAQIAGLKNSVKANVVRQLLPVIDSFDRALKHVPADLAHHDYIKGVQSVVKQFEKTLADMGVSRVKTVGHPFDPHYHEAVSAEEGEGTEEIVSDELQAGYVLGSGEDEEVVRHAMVRVKMQ